jgi:hypothetical protein
MLSGVNLERSSPPRVSRFLTCAGPWDFTCLYELVKGVCGSVDSSRACDLYLASFRHLLQTALYCEEVRIRFRALNL